MSATGWRILTWVAAGTVVVAVGVPIVRAIGWKRTVGLATRLAPAVTGLVSRAAGKAK